jgi:nitrite reductase/ring-hydroxylating ferredoxin subunit
MSKRICIGPVEEFRVGTLTPIAAEGTLLVVARTAEDQFCAVLDECSHLLLPLADGKLDGTIITCPHHGSEFDMCTGENLDWVKRRAGMELPRWSRRLLDRGKKPRPLTTVSIFERDGSLYVEL